MPHVAVIGAGITGITTAYSLSKRGFDVTVYDRNRYAAMETSYANGGQLSASNAEVWNSWATVLKGIKWMFTPGAPLLVNPSPSWHKLSWMTEFLAAIPQYETNTITTARLAIEARSHLRKMAADENIQFNCENRGILHFYYSKPEFDAAARVTELLKKGGLERQPVTPAEIRTIEPALKGNYYGGFYTPSDFSGDIHRFTMGLAKACERRGVRFMLDRNVDSIRTDHGAVQVASSPNSQETDSRDNDTQTFDQVVICAGVYSRDIASSLGDRVNVYPVKGYSITINLRDESDQAAAPHVSLLDDRAKIVASRFGNRFRVAGTAEFTGRNKDIRAERIKPLIDWSRDLFPGMSTEDVVPWAGLRPMMPNMMPRVMRGRHPRVYYNTGHGHLGWTLSAATADAISALVEADAKTNAAPATSRLEHAAS